MSQSSWWVIKRALCSAPEVDLHRWGTITHICSAPSASAGSVPAFAFKKKKSHLFRQHVCVRTPVCVCLCVFSAWTCECLPEEGANESTQQCTHFLSLIFSLSTRSFHLPPTTCSVRVMKVTHVGVIENERGSVHARVCVRVSTAKCCQRLYVTLPAKPNWCNQVCCLLYIRLGTESRCSSWNLTQSARINKE